MKAETLHAASSLSGTGQPRDAHRWIWESLRLLLGALFIYTGGIKALDPIRFAGDIENYHILPWAFGVRLAFYLPWLEILCGAALLMRRYRPGALLVLTALMLVFVISTIAAKARGLDITCGCFGHPAKPMTFAAHLAVDLAIMAALSATWWREDRRSR